MRGSWCTRPQISIAVGSHRLFCARRSGRTVSIIKLQLATGTLLPELRPNSYYTTARSRTHSHWSRFSLSQLESRSSSTSCRSSMSDCGRSRKRFRRPVVGNNKLQVIVIRMRMNPKINFTPVSYDKPDVGVWAD